MARENKPSLSLEDYVWLVDGSLSGVSDEGCGIVAEIIAEDPRFTEQRRQLEALSKIAGSDWLGGGLFAHQEVEQLLAAEGWEHPVEVLGGEIEDINYPQLIRVAAALAEQAEDPGPLLALERPLEQVAPAPELIETFIEQLLVFGPKTAERTLDWVARRYRARLSDAR